jgi:peptide chain release factor subunit 1
MYALEQGLLETIICNETLSYLRMIMRSKETQKIKVLYLRPDQYNDPKWYKDTETGGEMEQLEQIDLIEWLAENYTQFGCGLQFVTDKSSEGFQFLKGFTGLGGFLRYKLDYDILAPQDDIEENSDDEYV